jgi:hypothetical protein
MLLTLLLRYGRHVDARADFCHSGTARTRSYGVDAPAMLLQQHGWDIHAVSAEPDRAANRNHQSREHPGNAAAPGATDMARSPTMINLSYVALRWNSMVAASIPIRTAAAGLIWHGDLSRQLRQVLFDTADGVVF